MPVVGRNNTLFTPGVEGRAVPMAAPRRASVRWRWLLGVLLALGLGYSHPVAAGGLFGRPQVKPYISQGRTFSVQVPTAWTIREPGGNETHFQPAGPGVPSVSIRRFDVPANAHPRQLAMLALDQRLEKLPSYRKLQQRDVRVGGVPAVALTASYAHQGNLQYKRIVEEIYVVAGTDAFIIHFECFQPSVPQYAKSLERFYSSFIPRPVEVVVEPKKKKKFRINGIRF